MRYNSLKSPTSTILRGPRGRTRFVLGAMPAQIKPTSKSKLRSRVKSLQSNESQVQQTPSTTSRLAS